MQISRRIAITVLSWILSAAAGGFAPAENGAFVGAPPALSGPVHVFILGGQSNMFGLGHVAPARNRITLDYAVQREHLYPFLVTGADAWSVFRGIRFVQVISGPGASQSKRQWDAYWRRHSLTDPMPKNMMRTLYNQWLCVKGHRFIGPEFGIAHELAKVVHGPILLLKSCNGNRSIGWDLLPPGSKSEFFTDRNGRVWQYAAYGQTPNKWIKGTPVADRKRVKWYAGKEYDMDLTFAEYVLANIRRYYPGATSYRIDGFFFWQGDKDRYDPGYAAHYAKNMAAYIKAVRKDYGVPKAPFVLATLGQDVKGVTKGNDGLILKAQLAMENPRKYPAFAGNVATVYTHPLSLGGASNGHYNGNAQTYMNAGLAMGKAMDKLLVGK